MDYNGEMQVVAFPPAGTWHRRLAIARLAITAGVALLLVLTFVRLIDARSVLRRLDHLNVGLAVLCGLVFLSAYCVRALRWRWLLAPQRISAGRAIGIYQVATFVNWLLPIRGGELVKGLLLRRLYGMPLSRSLPTVAMDKATDLLPSVVLLAALPFLGLHLSRPLWGLLLVVVALLALGACFLALACLRRGSALALLGWGVAWLPCSIGQRVEDFLVGFLDTLLALVRRPRILAIAAAYTAVAVLLDALFCLLAFQAVGAAVAFPVVLYGYTFYNLAYVLPTPPGQIGSNEVVGLLVFSGIFNLNRTDVAAMFLFSHPWTALLMIVSGALCASAVGLTLRSALVFRMPQ